MEYVVCLEILCQLQTVVWILNYFKFIKTLLLQHLKPTALPVKFSELQETDRNKFVQEGSPVVLSCELSHDPSAHVDWFKDGMKLLPQNNMEIQSDGLTRTLLIHSAENINAGTYACSTSDDTITFKVDVKGDLFLSLPCHIHLLLWCEW